MKTTVEISGALLSEAKQIASKEGTTLRELIEAGLRHVLSQRRRRSAFSLRDASAGSGGLAPEFADAGWNQIRDAAYEGHGS